MTPDSVRQAKEVLKRLNKIQKVQADYKDVFAIEKAIGMIAELARYKNALIEITMIDIADNRARDIAKQSLAGEKEII